MATCHNCVNPGKLEGVDSQKVTLTQELTSNEEDDKNWKGHCLWLWNIMRCLHLPSIIKVFWKVFD